MYWCTIHLSNGASHPMFNVGKRTETLRGITRSNSIKNSIVLETMSLFLTVNGSHNLQDIMKLEDEVEPETKLAQNTILCVSRP